MIPGGQSMRIRWMVRFNHQLVVKIGRSSNEF
jgi:hypothetical protein